MPRSRSRRHSRRPAPPPKPKPSPSWIAPVGLGAIGLGVGLVILSYIVALPGGPLNLLLGFAVMAVGLVVLSRLR